MAKNLILGLLTVITLLTQVSCTSIISGTSEKIMVTSEPPGATVTTDAGITFLTPSVVVFKKGKAITMTAEKEGYEKRTQILDTTVDPCLVINILWLDPTIIGTALIIDILNGSWKQFQSDYINFYLTPTQKKN